jgi:hypothetical protein
LTKGDRERNKEKERVFVSKIERWKDGERGNKYER